MSEASTEASNTRSEPLRELGYDQSQVPAEKANQAPEVTDTQAEQANAE